ncbi:hypothetical protein ACCQ08_22970 [Comamonas sp. SY3]|uniref:hypothetical protein n=1 Tax=Comamonas sp. SY3 TaxID=3243601 RepID=UPI003593F977
MTSALLFNANGVSLFNQRVISRPETATVFVERPSKDPLAARLEESLRQVAQAQRKLREEQSKAAPVRILDQEVPAL